MNELFFITDIYIYIIENKTFSAKNNYHIIVFRT